MFSNATVGGFVTTIDSEVKRGVKHVTFTVQVRTIHAGVARFTHWRCNLTGLQANLFGLNVRVGDGVTVTGVAYQNAGIFTIDAVDFYKHPTPAVEDPDDHDDHEPFEHLPIPF